MSISAPSRGTARARGVMRPIAVLIAVFIGLGGLGGAAGMALGAVGAASSTAHFGGGHHHEGAGPGPRMEP